MRIASRRIVPSALALALAASFAISAGAEPSLEAQSASASCSLSDIGSTIVKAITDNKVARAIKKDIEKGKTDGRAEVVRNGGCLPGTYPSQEGENGIVCRSEQQASVSCKRGHNEETIDGEMGKVTRFVCDELDPPGGWAGVGEPDGPEAPLKKKPGRRRPRPAPAPRPAPEPPQAP